MKKTPCGIILLMLGLLIMSVDGYSQATFKDGLILKSTAVVKTRGFSNPNILKGPPDNDDSIPPPPKEKGGKEADCGCSINLDNNTGYCIDMYVDGNYKCTIGSYQKSAVTNVSGDHTVYLLNTSKTKEWKVEGSCKGSYSWKIED